MKYAKEIILKKGGNFQDIKQVEDLAKKEYEYYQELNSKVHFIFILVYSSLMYIIYKILIYRFEYEAILTSIKNS